MPIYPRTALAVALASSLISLSAGYAIAADSPAPTSPAPQAAPAPRFDIKEFRVAGNTLLEDAKIKAIVAPFTGSSKDFGDVQQALEALQDAYQEAGYSSVRVLLPEQELEQGSVLFQVIEQKISAIKVEGNTHYSTENVLRAIPSLKQGELPNIKKIGNTLKIANQNATKQTAVLFEDSEKQENSIEANVKVIDEKPWKAFASVDNTGNRESGQGRISLGYQNFNMFDRDQRLTAQYITTPHSPEHIFNTPREVHILGLAYTIPLYSLGDSIDLITSYSHSTSTTPTALTGILGDISGNGLVYGARYNHTLPKIKAYEQKITFSFDSKETRSTKSTIGGIPVILAPAVTSTPFGLTYSGEWAPGDQQLTFDLGAFANVTGIDNHGRSVDLTAQGFENDFKKWTYSVNFIKPLPKDWQIRIALNGQMSSDHLPPIEQFRAGGANSVRGFRESVVSGDKGYRWSIEGISPNFGKVLNDKVDLRAVVFTDQAYANSNTDITGANNASRYSIGSVGTGLRMNYGQNFVGRLDFAYVLDGDTSIAGGTREHGDKFTHVSMSWIW